MSWDPRDDEEPPRKPSYRNSTSLCPCDMCSEDPAQETELDPEEFN